MDPDAVHRLIDELLAKHDIDTTNTDEIPLHAIEELLGHFVALWEWLENGGFVPAAWEKDR